jgi:hypothetical protein
LENPACVEIGAVGYNVKSVQARSNCLNVVSSVLTRDSDKELVRSLKLNTKITQKIDGMTFETTLPDEPDAYGGWWISIYDEKELSNARASREELLTITQPKTKPKFFISVATQSPNYWSSDDIPTYSRPSASSGYNGGEVYVHGYYRANGTYVNGYTRSAPHSR